MSGYIGYLPATVRLDSRLTPMSKVMYAELTSLASSEGLVRVRQEVLATTFQIDTKTVSRSLNNLAEFEFISKEKDGRIRLNEMGTVIRVMKPTNRNIKKIQEMSVETTVTRILRRWNKLYGTKLGESQGSTDYYSEIIIARLETFTEEEILHAIDTRYESTKDEAWWNKPENIQHKVNLDLIIKSDEKLRKYVEMPKIEDKTIKPFEFAKADKKIMD